MPLVGELIKTALPLPDGRYGNVFIVDPTNGDDSNPGDTFEKPFKTLAVAYAACVSGQNDVVIYVPGTSALELSAAIDWSKSYTHLIGLCAPTWLPSGAAFSNSQPLPGQAPCLPSAARAAFSKTSTFSRALPMPPALST
jgi:hypothetical protein